MSRAPYRDFLSCNAIAYGHPLFAPAKPLRLVDISDAEFRRLYVEENLTGEEIGAIFGCTGNWVAKQAQARGIFKGWADRRLTKRWRWSEAQKQKIRGGFMPNAKAIEQIKNGRVVARHESIMSAARSLGLGRSQIRRVLSGEFSQSGGYGWRYAATYGELSRAMLGDRVNLKLDWNELERRLSQLPERLPKTAAIAYYNERLLTAWKDKK